jgi:hypothetical protein
VNEHPEYELLDGYALGTLAEPDAGRVRTHLNSCAACRAELGELRAVLDVLPQALPGIKPSARARERIFAGIDAAKSAPRARFSPWVAALAAALALAVGLDLWLASALYRTRNAPARAAAVAVATPVAPRTHPPRDVPSPSPARPSLTASPAASASAAALPASNSSPAPRDAALLARIARLEDQLTRERLQAQRDGARSGARIAALEGRLAEADARVVALAHPSPAPAPTPSASAPAVAPDLVAALSTGRVFGVDGVVGSEPWHLTIVQPPGGKDARIFTRTPGAPEGDTYRTWVLRGAQTFDAGELPPSTQTELEMPMPLQTGDQVAFSREAVGSGSRPTSPYLMKVTIGP